MSSDKIFIGFISHKINDLLVERFNIIKKSIPSNYIIKYVSPNTNIESPDFEIVHLGIDKLFDDNNYGNTKNHLIYLSIFKKYYDYDYYWLIENDVTINNDNLVEGWRNLFDYYNNDKSDLICSKIHKWVNSAYHQRRYIFSDFNKYICNPFLQFNYDKLWFGFFPICRLSNNLLKYTNEYYSNNDGFFEYIIPSLAYHNNLQIRSFTDDKFDIEYNLKQIKDINRGSISWTIKDINNYKNKFPKNVIIHPNKL